MQSGRVGGEGSWEACGFHPGVITAARQAGQASRASKQSRDWQAGLMRERSLRGHTQREAVCECGNSSRNRNRRLAL
eukprot:COSAG04_NODE_1740_length_5739_cov_3.695035_2_plen_77_part_00